MSDEVTVTVTKGSEKGARPSNNTTVVGNSYPSPYLKDLFVINRVYQPQDMERWKVALNAVRNNYRPSRWLLQQLYADIATDTHVAALLKKRAISITNKRVKAYNADGTENMEVNQLICDTPWFFEMLHQRQLARFYGPALVEFKIDKGRIVETQLIPRHHIVPEMGVVVKQPYDLQGYSYLTDEWFYKTTMPLGDPHDYGIMLNLARWVIIKRGVVNDAQTFSELFAMPMRVGKYNPFDDNTRNKLVQAFETQGSQGWMVIPDGASIEFIEAKASRGSDFFNALADYCNKEMSKEGLLNTMTLEQGKDGARSLGEVHERAEDALMLSDVRDITIMLNNGFKDRMLKLGYPVANIRFEFDLTEQLNLAALGDFLSKTVPLGFQVPMSYMHSRTGIPTPKPGEEVLKQEQGAVPLNNLPDSTETDKTDPKTGKPGKDKPAMQATMQMRVEKHYGGQCGACGGTTMQAAPISDYTSIMLDIARRLHRGEDITLDKALMAQTAADLLKAIETGFNAGLTDGPTDADNALLAELKQNIYVFSGAKTYTQLRQMADMLVENGQAIGWGAFKQKVLQHNQVYNIDYLQTEYVTAMASAQQGAYWKEIERNAEDLPMLRYSAVLDARTQPLDASLNGTVAPVTDAVWNTYYPPLHYNCRCTVQQDTIAGTKGQPRIDASVLDLPPVTFRNNVGKTGVVFPDTHPYFDELTKKDLRQIDKAVNDIKK